MCLEAFPEALHVLATRPEGAHYTADATADYDLFGPHVSRFMHSLGVPSPHFRRSFTQAEIVTAMGFDPARMPPGTSARGWIAAQMRAAFGAEFSIDLSGTSTAEMMDSVQYSVFPDTAFFPGIHAAHGVPLQAARDGSMPLCNPGPRSTCRMVQPCHHRPR